MKNRTTILVLLILTLAIYASKINVQIAAEENDYRTTSLELTPHEPIWITSDSSFEVFPGTGTKIDPYLIEGYNITTTSSRGIYITDTTKYFVIRNCYVDATYDGIFIDNIADGTATVINNTCSNNNWEGIRLEYSGSSIVVNNTCSNNNWDGIRLSSSVSSTVVNNTCSNNNGDGIKLWSSGSSTVVNNTCSNNNIGIYLYSSGSSMVVNNTCSNNNGYSIWFVSSGSSTVENNTFTNCGLEIREYTINAYLSYTVKNNWVNRKKIGFYTNLDSTIIAEPVYGQLILVNCNLVTVRDQMLNNASVGLFLYSCTSSVIINNTCSNNNGYGISIEYSGSSTVANNTCSNNNNQGIYLYYSGSSTVVNNTCNNNYLRGIWLYYSVSSTVANNTFTNCGLYIIEDTLAAYLSYTVENNWVNEKILGFYTNLDSTTIANLVYGQLIFVNCTNVTVRDQILNNATTGLFLYFCTYSTITNNTCSSNGRVGIYLESSSSSTVINNTCSNNGYGIKLYSSGSSKVTNNTCSNNNYYGIFLVDSGSSTVVNNTCSNNIWYGIYLSTSGSSKVVINTCNNNNRGIKFYSSDFCVVTYNLLQENEEYGISLAFDSDNNIFHHNTFIDNYLGGTSQAFDEGTNNFWYDTTTQEGNYWSDWSEVGSYSINGPANSVDLYPLGEPVVAEYTQIALLTLLLSMVTLFLTRTISKKTKK